MSHVTEKNISHVGKTNEVSYRGNKRDGHAGEPNDVSCVEKTRRSCVVNKRGPIYRSENKLHEKQLFVFANQSIVYMFLYVAFLIRLCISFVIFTGGHCPRTGCAGWIFICGRGC